MASLLLPLSSSPAVTRQACFVMVDLVGSTSLAQQLPVGHYAALMTEFVQLLFLSFEACGGHILQHQGDAVLAFWPEEQAEQAVLAALGAHGRAARLGLAGALGLSLRLRAAVTAGEVVTGPIGGQLSAYGLPVNFARRLCGGAQPGQTLVCQTVQSGCAGTLHLEFAALGEPLQLRDFGSGCEVFAVRHAQGGHQMKVG
ncbi:adenylate/guanylate cyclase domain-containing protein [Deinococcus petrolearius]|uniref:Adenylate/guanylate cyclase domain-containing protein n=1 Tax=Deinococcus petrolearius TaxID=1751295 RepID=A0ABW1DNF7_9DEIO